MVTDTATLQVLSQVSMPRLTAMARVVLRLTSVDGGIKVRDRRAITERTMPATDSSRAIPTARLGPRSSSHARRDAFFSGV